jgi:choline kinase
MCPRPARGYRKAMATTAPAGPGRARRERARAGEAAGGSALLFATATAEGGAPAALLEVEGTTLVARLIEQLASLGVRRAAVVARGHDERALRAAVARSPIAVDVILSADVTGDLQAAGAAARAAGDERLLLACADIVAHREALAGLLCDPRIATGVLAASDAQRDPWAYGLRTAHGRVVGAASPYHRVRSPDQRFLGVIKVDARDLPSIADVAARLAAATGGPRLQDELRRNAETWRAQGDEERVERARQDALSPLLVGLVRADGHVGSADVRDFFYARPRTARDAALAAERLRFTDEDRLLLDAAVKSSDGFFTTHFVSPYSKHLARFAARRGWTPNAVTLASLVVGLAAAGAFATGSRAGLIAGAVLLQAAFTVDCVDGQLARYTRTFSRLGAWMDSIFDVWTLAACALALQTARHMLDFSWAAERHEAIATASHAPLDEPGDGPDDDRRGPVLVAAVRAPALRPAPAGPGVETVRRSAVVTRAAARDPEPQATPGASRGGVRGLAGRGVGAIGALESRAATRWAKRIIALPIGERFALISITAAIWNPRVTFTALLIWGAMAAAYSVGGRLLRSVAA